MKHFIYLLICIITVSVISSCRTTSNPLSESGGQGAEKAGDVPTNQSNLLEPEAVSGLTNPLMLATFPPVMIYKTQKDYSLYVPVILAPDHQSIVSYPDIRDVYFEGKLSYPLILAGGYWLDNRNVGINMAFLNFTYEQYSQLESTPLPIELIKHILIADPLTELYSCKCKRDTIIINDMIRRGDFSLCKKLK